MISIRKSFPVLERRVANAPLVYLDSAATALRPQAVIDAVAAFDHDTGANVRRAGHLLAAEATEMWETTRAHVARWAGVPHADQIVFTPNCTTALNLAAFGWALPRLRTGDEIVVTRLEHHANFLPWQEVARRSGATLKIAPLDRLGCLDYTALESLLGPHTRAVAATALSNVTGERVDVARVVAAVRAAAPSAAVIVDAAQTMWTGEFDFAASGADFAAFSAHKMLGPMGLGALAGKPERLEETQPLVFGGGIVTAVTEDGFTPHRVPWRFEAGTPAAAAAAGWRAATDFLAALGKPALARREHELTGYLLEKLRGVPGLRVFGPDDIARRGAVFSFELSRGGQARHPVDVAAFLDARGICVRAGTMCAQPLLRSLGVASIIRASCGPYTLEAEIDQLCERLAEFT